MTAFLARTRRPFLAGIVSLIALIAMGKDLTNQNTIQTVYYYFFGLSPIIYPIYGIISAFLIRHFGQFKEVHKRHNFFYTFFKQLGSDIISPLKNVWNFFTSLFGKPSNEIPVEIIHKSKSIFLRRLIWTVFVIMFCVIGVLVVY